MGGGGGEGDLALAGGCGGFLATLLILLHTGDGVTEEEYLRGAGRGGGSVSSSSLGGGEE